MRAESTRATAEERALPEGFRWRRTRRGAVRVFELVPRRRAAVVPVMIASAWTLFLVLTVSSIVRGRTGFIFLPIVIVPMKRVYRSLCVTLNRLEFRLQASRFTATQRPIPRGAAVARPIQDIRAFSALELDEYLGRWFGEEETKRWWTVTLVERDGALLRLPFVVPSEVHAHTIADELNEALVELREPVSYRG